MSGCLGCWRTDPDGILCATCPENTCSLCAAYTRSLRDRAVIDPSGPGYEPGVLHGFVRSDGGGGNRTRVMPLCDGSAQGSEPLLGLVTRLVRCLCGALTDTRAATNGHTSNFAIAARRLGQQSLFALDAGGAA